MGRDGEGDKKEVKGWKGRRKDLPDLSNCFLRPCNGLEDVGGCD